MRNLLIVSMSFFCLHTYTQECNFYNLNGSKIIECDGYSVNSVVEHFFESVEMIDTYSGTDNKNCDGYELVFKKYTEVPLFLFGKFPKNKKKLKKCIDSYNVLETYFDYSFKNDLDEMIEKKKSKEYVIGIFGDSNRETIDKTKELEIIICNYEKYYDTVKFDLIFVNNVLNRYILRD